MWTTTNGSDGPVFFDGATMALGAPTVAFSSNKNGWDPAKLVDLILMSG